MKPNQRPILSPVAASIMRLHSAVAPLLTALSFAQRVEGSATDLSHFHWR